MYRVVVERVRDGQEKSHVVSHVFHKLANKCKSPTVNVINYERKESIDLYTYVQGKTCVYCIRHVIADADDLGNTGKLYRRTQHYSNTGTYLHSQNLTCQFINNM